jgi:ribose transport system substrate-binding protein
MRLPASACSSLELTNYHAGQIGGQRLAKGINGKGNVVVFTIPEQANLKERLARLPRCARGYAGIKITRVVDMKGDSRVAFDTATEILGNDKKEQRRCLRVPGSAVRQGSRTYYSQHEVKDKIIIAMDTDDKTLEWIQKGVIAATIFAETLHHELCGIENAGRPFIITSCPH